MEAWKGGGRFECRSPTSIRSPLVNASKDEEPARESKQLKSKGRDFPGGPLVKTSWFQRKWYEFDPWLGN